MAEKYVEDGYVENGYVEGSGDYIKGGAYKMRFFVKNGEEGSDAIEAFVNASEQNIALVIGLNGMPISIVGKGFSYSVAGAEPESIKARIEEIESKISNIEKTVNTSINKSVSIVAADGTIVSTTIAKIAGDGTLEITVPEEVVGTRYGILIKSNN